MPSCRLIARILAAVTWIAGTLDAAVPVNVQPDSAKQLLLDERVIQSRQNVRLELGRIEKFAANPTMRADRPWENALNNLYPNVAVDPAGSGLKLWYKCVVHDPDAIARMANPVTIHEQGWYLLFAESPDGKSWNRPLSPRFQFDRQETNAVCQDVANVGVLFDVRDADESRRYKMIYDVGHGKLRVRFSSNGLDWSAPLEAEGFGPYHGDTHNNAFWDERLQKYVLISRAYYGERLVARFESRDFIHWEQARVVLRSTLSEGKQTQLYCMPAFPYANGYIGYATMYHVGAGRTVDVELAYSEDSIQWRRILPGRKLIPRGTPGSIDAGCIYPPAGPAIQQADKLLLVYGGSQAIHKDWKRSCEPCLATLPLDGFAGYIADAPEQPGLITTQPLLLVSPAIKLSASIDRGSVRVRLKPGKESSEVWSLPLTSNAADQPLEFPKIDITKLIGRAVELNVEISGDAQIYSISGVELLPAPVPSSAARSFSQPIVVRLHAPQLSPRALKSLGEGVIRYTDEDRPVAADDPAAPADLHLDGNADLRARMFYRDGQIAGATWTAAYRRVDAEFFPVSPERQFTADFSKGMAGWKALDTLEAGRDDRGHFLIARRDPGYGVFLIGSLESMSLNGNWHERFKASAVEISFRMRSPASGSPARLELSPPDLPGWHYQGFRTVATDWTDFSTVIDLDWNDAEAEAAGWIRPAAGFSWQETISTLGTLVIGTAAHPERTQIDVAELRLRAMSRGK